MRPLTKLPRCCKIIWRKPRTHVSADWGFVDCCCCRCLPRGLTTEVLISFFTSTETKQKILCFLHRNNSTTYCVYFGRWQLFKPCKCFFVSAPRLLLQSIQAISGSCNSTREFWLLGNMLDVIQRTKFQSQVTIRLEHSKT